jgi:hypothetical protein
MYVIDMMTPKLRNSLLFHMTNIHESSELADDRTQEYEEKFNALDKWDQMEVDRTIQLDGWEYGISRIDRFWEKL